MGNVNVRWANKEALDYLKFLKELLGNPSSFILSPDGWAIWTKKKLLNKTLFGKNLCFDKIIIKDEIIIDKPGQKNFLYLIAQAPINYSKVCEMNKFIPNCGYDQTKQSLWVRCDSLDTGILTMKCITDYANDKTTLNQYPMIYDSLMLSVNSSNNVSSKIEITKVLYSDLCTNLAKLISKTTPVATPTTIPEKSTAIEHMYDDPWYGGYGPFYASNQAGNIALGEEENELYYRRMDEKPLIFPSIKSKNMLSSPLPASEQVAISLSPDSSFMANTSVERLSAPSANCNGACIDRYYSTLGKENFSDVQVANFFRPGSAMGPQLETPTSKITKKIVGLKKEYFNSKSPITLAQAYSFFEPKKEYLNLFSISAHNSRLENMSDKQIYNVFQPGSSGITLVLPNKKKEYIGANDHITLNQAYALFKPNILTKSEAVRLEKMSTPANMGDLYKLFQPRNSLSIEEMTSYVDMNKLPQLFQERGLSSIEHMNTSLGVDSQVKSCQIFLNEIGKKENLDESSRDPRFLPYNALIKFQVGSDVVDIDRVYGTKAQKIRYPKYTDLLQYGLTSVPSEKKVENFTSFVGDQFYEG